MQRTEPSSWPVVRLTDAQYTKLVEAHRERTRVKAEGVFDRALLDVLGSKATLRTISAHTGLSQGTISRYRNRGWGSRGPLLTTYLALRGDRK